MTLVCGFCNTKFKNVSSLNNHIRTAKYCLIKQGKIEKPLENFQCKKCNKILSTKRNFNNHNCEKKTKQEFKCDICDKFLCSKQYLNIHKIKCSNKDIINDCQYCYKVFDTENSLIIHQTKCVKKFEWQINELEKNKLELQNKLEKALNKPTKQINNNTLNINNIDFMSYMTEERIKDIFNKNFTLKTLYGSNEALVDFTINNFLLGEDKPIYLCADKERKKFYFLDKDNKRIDDTNAKILTNLLVIHGFEYVKQIYNNHIENIKDQPAKLNDSFNTIMSLKKNNKDYISHLSDKLPKTIEERSILTDINNTQKVIEDKNKVIEYVVEETDSDSELDEDKYEIEDILCSILGITKYKLSVYKKWYIETGEIKVTNEFKHTDKNIDMYKKYLQS